MLKEVRDLIGLDGLIQILLDALSEEDLDRFEKERAASANPGLPLIPRAEGIARLACESPTLQPALAEALDGKNASLIQDLSKLSSEDLLRDYSPQNADLMSAPGCLLWSLFRCQENEDCLRLLQIWNDYLVNRSSGTDRREKGRLARRTACLSWSPPRFSRRFPWRRKRRPRLLYRLLLAGLARTHRIGTEAAARYSGRPDRSNRKNRVGIGIGATGTAGPDGGIQKECSCFIFLGRGGQTG
jgi:hypothetical protein